MMTGLGGVPPAPGGAPEPPAAGCAAGPPSAHARPVSGEGALRERYEMALRAGRIGTWSWNVASGVLDCDGQMEEVFGLAPGSSTGSPDEYVGQIHPDDRQAVVDGFTDTLRRSEAHFQIQPRILWPDGTTRWVDIIARLVLDESHQPLELVGVVVDVTDRRRMESERLAAVQAEERAWLTATAAQRRMAMLARMSSLLDAPLDLAAIVQQVANIATTELADWCFIDLLDGTPSRPVVIAHRDPDSADVAAELLRRFPSSATSAARETVLRTLKPMLVPGLDGESVDATVPDGNHAGRLQQIQIASYLMVPMVSAGRAVGILVLLSTEGRLLDDDDVEIATELGRRAGSAIHKTRLYADLQATTQVLQRSLLPPSLPDVPGLTLSAYYSSGTQGMEIGGDYYDVFSTQPDRWWVVLGDVCGKGPAAATLTSKVRHAVQAIASGNDNPSRVLRLLNDVLLTDNPGDNFTTLVLATFVSEGGRYEGGRYEGGRYEGGQYGGEVDRSEPLRLRIVSGGHPAAMLRTADGRVQLLKTPGRLVGILPDHDAATITLYLSPGDTLLLYTDGATEARDAYGIELGEETLVGLLAEAEPTESPDLAERIYHALLELAPGGLSDDVALLTLTR